MDIIPLSSEGKRNKAESRRILMEGLGPGWGDDMTGMGSLTPEQAHQVVTAELAHAAGQAP